ncbi:MAG: 3-hydroxyacyl-CoA dehydrogenase NAD-binding domain-containing protein [Lysobacterales bacterium]
MTCVYESRGDVAVLTLNNPPVNGLGLATRQAFLQALDAAEQDANVRAIVIAGAGKSFCGGADIREFGRPEALAEPNLLTLIDRVEACSKPVVMAIQGVCMGGGTELSLGAHARVVARDAQVGLPEVKIGLVPGAGGTQRLPRALGLQPALEIIVSGNPAPAAQLASIPGQRLIDVLAEGDLLQSAIDHARACSDRGLRPRLREQRVEADAALIAAARQRAQAQSAAYPAVHACIDCVEAAAALDFDAGIALERAAFARLMDSPESRALRHAFFAERACAKVPDVPEQTPVRPIERVGVVGAGTMGSGIAMSLLNAGLQVTLVDSTPAALERGVAQIRKQYESSVKRGAITTAQAEQRLDLLETALQPAACADCDLIIEAVYEDLAVKEAVFRTLDASARPGAILASNTSTLDLDRIAACTSRPADVIGLHFFSPAQVMKLLEIVRGAATAKEVLASALALARRIGKTAVVAGNCDGFIGNRMIEQYSRQAGFLLEEGALPQQIDAAMERFGFAMGPFRMSDLAGNDIGWAIRKRRAVERPGLRYPGIFDRLCEAGRYGQKTGAGWYDYRPGDRQAHASAWVDALVIGYSAEIGIERRAISEQEIVERLVYSLVNEGARLLDEGIAIRASDIDVVYLTGYGFPRYRGGPMAYADEVGLPQVIAAMERYAAADAGDRQSGAWTVAERLRRCVAAGQPLSRG